MASSGDGDRSQSSLCDQESGMYIGARQGGDFLRESNQEKIWETETVRERKLDDEGGSERSEW